MEAKQTLRRDVPKKSFMQKVRADASSVARWVREHFKMTVFIAVAAFLIKTERDRESEIRDQQADVSSTGLINFPVPGELYVPRVAIVNNGKTTAYGAGGTIHVAVGTVGATDPSFDAKGYQSHHLVDIPSHKGQFQSQALIDPQLGSPAKRLQIQNELLADVAAGKLNVWIYGGANYTTEFGDKGWVSYCALLQPSLQDVYTCPGDRNQVRIESKNWLQTLLSDIPKGTRQGH